MENITLLSRNGQLNLPSGSPISIRIVRAPPATGERAEPTLGVKFVSAGVAACLADLLTFPLDTAKVRLQIQGEGTLATTGSGSLSASAAGSGATTSAASQYRSLPGTLCTIVRQEGPRALYSGLTAGLQRQMCFASVRIGLYDSVKTAYSGFFPGQGNGSTMTVRLLAGCTTGALAVACAQPTDVVKVRMQAQRANAAKRYTGVVHAYRQIGAQEGVRGLWKGSTPNVARNSIVNCCELVSYDVIKDALIRYQLLRDAAPCHAVSGVGAGFITTLLASPIDVIKTRFMNAEPGTYRGVTDCALVMARTEGPAAFYKGFTPSFIRLVSWSVVMFVCYEQLKLALTSNPTSSLPSIEIERKRFM